MTPFIMLITKTSDHEGIVHLVNELKNRKARVLRFNTDLYPTNVQLDLELGIKEKLIYKYDEIETDLSELTSVYYRRVDYGANLPKDMDPQLKNVSVEETRRTVRGLITSLDVFHLDYYPNVQRASHKQLQLKIAAKLGLQIPKTLYSNNALAVREFAGKCNNNIITKMLSSFAIYDRQGKENVVFTTPVSKDDLKNLNGLDLCPMVFQENIKKKVELRITIVGNRLFCAAIDSGKYDTSRDDWRKEGVRLINDWHHWSLPSDIKDKLFNLMIEFNLQYGAIDMIVTPDNHYVFLEINPVGEYFWLDKIEKPSISNALADVLLGKNRL